MEKHPKSATVKWRMINGSPAVEPIDELPIESLSMIDTI